MNSRIRQFTNKLAMRLLALLGFSSTFAFMACYGPPPKDHYTEAFPGEINAPRDSSQQEVTVSSNGRWTVTGVPDFVRVDTTDGEGVTTLHVTVLPNEGDSLRQGVIVIEGEDTIQAIHITQEA